MGKEKPIPLSPNKERISSRSMNGGGHPCDLRGEAMEEPPERTKQTQRPEAGNVGEQNYHQALQNHYQTLQDYHQGLMKHHQALMKHHQTVQVLYRKLLD